MPKENDELVFIKPEEIPTLSRGKLSRNWTELFNKIPKNTTAVMTKDKFGSSANIRQQSLVYNKTHKNALKTTTRTNKETGEVITYVTRTN